MKALPWFIAGAALYVAWAEKWPAPLWAWLGGTFGRTGSTLAVSPAPFVPGDPTGRTLA